MKFVFLMDLFFGNRPQRRTLKGLNNVDISSNDHSLLVLLMGWKIVLSNSHRNTKRFKGKINWNRSH